MTIATQAAKAIGRGNGATTSWPYAFRIDSAADVLVSLVDSAGAVTTIPASQYAISGLGSNNGGVVTYPLSGSPLAVGVSIVIERILSYTQPTQLENQGGYYPRVVEEALDRVTMLIQQLRAGVRNSELSLTFPSVDVDPETELPAAAARANKYLAFDGSGNPVMMSGTSSNPDVSGNTVLPSSGTLARTLAAIFSDYVNVKAYNAKGDGTTDDTAAIVAAKAAALLSSKRLYFPRGLYVVRTANAIVFDNGLEIIGDGRYQSLIYFRPSGAGSCFKVTAGAARVNQFTMSGIGFFSDDTVLTKVALDVYDLSACRFSDIVIFGSGGAGPSAGVCWSGAGSIGIRTHGREACGWRDIEIVADKPFNIAANPNTAPNDNEDADHFNFHDIYAIANGFPVWNVDNGLGMSNCSWSGYQAWVGGTAGFKMNDTRTGVGVLRSRHLSFENVRHEQCTDPNGYAFDCSFTDRVEAILFRNILMSSTSQGIKLAGYERAIMEGVQAATAAGKNALLCSGEIAQSTLSLIGCNWQAGATFNVGAMFAHFKIFRSADMCGPSTAFYSGQVPGSACYVETVTAQQSAASTKAADFLYAAGSRWQLLPGATGVTARSVKNDESDFDDYAIQFKTFNLQYRTGVGTVADMLTTDSGGNVYFKKGLAPPPSNGVAAQTSRVFYVTGGAPNNANGNDGDVCFRTDGGAGTTMYHKRGGAWVGVV